MSSMEMQNQPGAIKSHRDLVAWQRSIDLGLSMYKLTAAFPDSERYGLTTQPRRAGISVASNISEGYGRGSTTDYVRFLRMARGSLYEMDTQLLFAVSLKYIPQEIYDAALEQTNNCGRLLAGLIRSLEPRTHPA